MMQAQDSFEQVVVNGLAALGVDADEVELAVLRAAHELYWPIIQELDELDLSEALPEPGADFSRAPEQ